jgi:hypothetical protein
MPNDRTGQRRIISEGLKAAAAMTEPGSIHDLAFRFVDDDWKAEPMSWSRKRQSGNGHSPRSEVSGRGSASADTRTARSADPVYQSTQDAEAAAVVGWATQCLVCIGIPAPDES